jgi:signal transduction histidine kinase
LQPVLKPGQNITLINKTSTDIAYLDHSMFHHIISNLLSNAIKYSPDGSTVDLIIEQNDPKLIIRVKDRGIGIPQKEQLNLYKRFFRCSNAANIQGTGLGLNIVKKYVEVLDGTIVCVSEENKGTEFTISFNNHKEHYGNGTSC